jgi:hypothetical protein
MKFTKDEAYKELVAKMTAKGEKLNLSERSFNEQLDQLLPLIANDETEIADFVDKVLPLFKTADANVRNDVSVGINEYKKLNPIEKKTEPKLAENDALLERLSTLELKLKQSEEKEYVSNVKKSLIAKVKEKGVKDTEWVSSILENVSIDKDFDVDAHADSYVQIYNKMRAGFDDDTTPKSATGGKGKTTIQDVINAAAEKQRVQSKSVNV